MSAPAVAALLGLDVRADARRAHRDGRRSRRCRPGCSRTSSSAPRSLRRFALGLRLALIIGGAALGAAVIRRLAGGVFIEAQAQRIDGLSVLMFMSFAIAAMDGVTAHIVNEPMLWRS